MEPLDVVRLAVSKLDKLGIPYMVAGSFTSSLYGFGRSTQDADLVVAMKPDKVQAFVKSFEGEFYVDRGSVERALRLGTSFNVIHFELSFKIDLFVLRERPYDQECFLRRRLEAIDPGSGAEAYVQSPEDTVLSKLEWYSRGGGVSEIQWRDVLGILKTQGTKLDTAYLRRWARELGLNSLLDKAVREAGPAE